MRSISFLFVCLSTALATSIPAATTSALSQLSASSASSSTSPTSPFSTPTSTVIETPTLATLEGEDPQVTSPPEILNGDIDQQLQEKYHQTTYWSCVTIATDVHCGWHEPILKGGDEIAGAVRLGKREELKWVWGLVGVAAGVLLR